MTSRRELLQKVPIVLAIAWSCTLTGCTIDDLKAWIPIALQGLSGILKLLGTISPTFALIQAGFADLIAAIASYQAGTGVLSDITNVISDIETNFQTFFSSLSVPTALLNTIEALAGLILSTLQYYFNQLMPNSSKSLSATFQLAGHSVAIVPKKRSIREFKSDWNMICVQKGYPNVEYK